MIKVFLYYPVDSSRKHLEAILTTINAHTGFLLFLSNLFPLFMISVNTFVRMHDLVVPLLG